LYAETTAVQNFDRVGVLDKPFFLFIESKLFVESVKRLTNCDVYYKKPENYA